MTDMRLAAELSARCALRCLLDLRHYLTSTKAPVGPEHCPPHWFLWALRRLS